ncbi:MAG: hypothetical protein RMJ67_06535 [Elusimicrobiota bacterium]|nr:hypothetical protein [Endomicrobiia bacterium]MDW8166150.1 hypothetical protein [Elusimicrobiota bacterium]
MRKCSIFIFLILVSCATQFTYYSTLKSLMSSENYTKADALIEENKLKEYGEKNALLYWLDKGIVLHYAGRYEDSILAFNKAEKLAEELYTKSISEEAASFLVSDNAKSYYGEDFERIFINVFQALNYLFLHKYESALVEARKVDHKLKTLQVDYGGKNVYKEDAFMRYLTGLLYESQNEFNDAYVSYAKSLKEYEINKKIYDFETPQDLIFRNLKLTKKLGFKEEFEEIVKKYKLNVNYKDIVDDKSTGEIILFHYNGFAPYKIDHYIEVTFGESWVYVGSVQVEGDAQKDVQKAKQIARGIASDEQFLVAFPKFVPSESKIKYAILEVLNDKKEVLSSHKSFLVEDIDKIAIKSLEDRITKIRAKAIARAAIKYALSRSVSQRLTENSDELSKWLVKKALQTASVVTEQADKRSWRTLPKQIMLTVANLKPGTYSLEIKFYDVQNNLVMKKTIDNVNVLAGKKTFISVRTYL